MSDWIRTGPIGFAKRVIGYRSFEIARVVQRNLPTITTPTQPNGDKIAIPELGISIDPFHEERLLYILPQLVSLKRNRGAKFARMESGEIEVSVDGMSILTETMQDLLIVYEVFEMRVYDIQIDADVVVWDIGANIGATGAFFGGCQEWKVFAHEPFPKTAQLAAKNFQRNGLTERVKLSVAAIGGQARIESVAYVHDWRGSNGIYGNTGTREAGTEERVDIEVLDAAEEFGKIRSQAKEATILVKMDCEGAEYEILRRLRETGHLESINALVLEVHPIPTENPELPAAMLLEAGMSILYRQRSSEGLQMIYAARIPST